jgi:D-beta-D-heptose 7-phosphate kinase/D-beta-D-heptose 1-phosphate adenosyltransferase
VKTRIVAQGQQIVRVDRDMTRVLPLDATDSIASAFGRLPAVDVVILSDYAKGVLARDVCRAIIDASLARGAPVIVDPKGRDYRRYGGATAITPNQAEAAQAIGRDSVGDDDFGELKDFFLGELALEAALITLSERGMCLLLPNREPILLPATARDVADVTGAGDTAAAVFALGLGAGQDFETAARLGNHAAGIVVGKAGTAWVSADELRSAQLEGSARRERQLRR